MVLGTSGSGVIEICKPTPREPTEVPSRKTGPLVFVVPSIVTGSVIAGRFVAGAIAGLRAGRSKVIWSTAVALGVALASRIACRSDPDPESFVFVTM